MPTKTKTHAVTVCPEIPLMPPADRTAQEVRRSLVSAIACLRVGGDNARTLDALHGECNALARVLFCRGLIGAGKFTFICDHAAYLRQAAAEEAAAGR